MGPWEPNRDHRNATWVWAVWPQRNLTDALRFHLDPAVSVTRDYNKIWNILCSQLCSCQKMRCISTHYIIIIKKLLKRSNKVYLFQIWNRETVFVFLVHGMSHCQPVQCTSVPTHLIFTFLNYLIHQIKLVGEKQEPRRSLPKKKKKRKSNHNKEFKQ